MGTVVGGGLCLNAESTYKRKKGGRAGGRRKEVNCQNITNIEIIGPGLVRAVFLWGGRGQPKRGRWRTC